MSHYVSKIEPITDTRFDFRVSVTDEDTGMCLISLASGEVAICDSVAKRLRLNLATDRLRCSITPRANSLQR